jgi:hypothetical protein
LGKYFRGQEIEVCESSFFDRDRIQDQGREEGVQERQPEASCEEDCQESGRKESCEEEEMISNLWTTGSIVAIACALTLPCTAQESSQAPAEASSMVSLFDGKSLGGWSGDDRLWSVRDGVIRGETTDENPASGNTFLIWKGGVLKDFELRLSFRCNATNNSGIQYRSKHITDGSVKNAWVVRGYQHEIRNESKFPNVSGFIYDEGGKRGRLCLVGEKAEWTESGKQVSESFLDEKEFQKLFRLDGWNDIVIIAKGNRMTHYLNDRLVLDFTDSDPKLSLAEGVLALQLHAGKPMWVEYRNIRLRSID